MAEGSEKRLHQVQAAETLRVVEPDEVRVADMGDEELMLEHGRGSEDAFAELVRRHQRGVLNYVYRMIQNRQIAEDWKHPEIGGFYLCGRCGWCPPSGGGASVARVSHLRADLLRFPGKSDAVMGFHWPCSGSS